MRSYVVMATGNESTVKDIAAEIGLKTASLMRNAELYLDSFAARHRDAANVGKFGAAVAGATLFPIASSISLGKYIILTSPSVQTGMKKVFNSALKQAGVDSYSREDLSRYATEATTLVGSGISYAQLGKGIGGAATTTLNLAEKTVIRAKEVSPITFKYEAGRFNSGIPVDAIKLRSYGGKIGATEGYGVRAEKPVLFSRKSQIDFAPTGFMDGQFYPHEKLPKLYEYLRKRGADIQPIPLGAKGPGFRACDPRTGKPTLYLPEKPTVLELKHELSHYLDFKKMGIEKYSSLTRLEKEQMVLDRLKGNRIWEEILNKQEKKFSQKYVDKLKIENSLKNSPGGPNVR